MNPAAPVTSILRIVIYSLGHFFFRKWFGNQIPDHRCNLAHSRDTVRTSGGERSLRHSVNDRALAILHDRSSPRASNSSQPFGSISSHPRKHYSDRGIPEGGGDREEQWISGRPHTPHCRRSVEPDRGVPRFAAQCHVVTARSDVHPILAQKLSIDSLGNPERAHSVEPLGQKLRKFAGHVLNDDHGRAQIFGEMRYYL